MDHHFQRVSAMSIQCLLCCHQMPVQFTTLKLQGVSQHRNMHCDTYMSGATLSGATLQILASSLSKAC
jgi:hypothetical protein